MNIILHWGFFFESEEQKFQSTNKPELGCTSEIHFLNEKSLSVSSFFSQNDLDCFLIYFMRDKNISFFLNTENSF